MKLCFLAHLHRKNDVGTIAGAMQERRDEQRSPRSRPGRTVARRRESRPVGPSEQNGAGAIWSNEAREATIREPPGLPGTSRRENDRSKHETQATMFAGFEDMKMVQIDDADARALLYRNKVRMSCHSHGR